MRALDQRAVSPGLQPAWRRVGAPLVTVVLVASLAWGCGTQPVPSPETPTPSAFPATLTPAAPTPSPTPAYADTLRIGGVDWGLNGMEMDNFRQASGGGAGGVPNEIITLGRLVYSALYRYDPQYNPIPDLADGPCLPQGDGMVIRCRLVQTTFQDGTPLTADDVAYSFDVYQRPTSLYGPWPTFKEVRAVDQRTVDFSLSEVDPRILTEVLPSYPILSRRAVEAAYARFVTATKGLTSGDLTRLADAIDKEANSDPPVCTTRLDAVGALLQRIGVRLYREDFTRSIGTFRACVYMTAASGFIRQAAAALGATGLDSVAAAFQLLSTDWEPVGTGPYRLVSEDANRIHLEAWPGYHGGLAATRYIDFVPTKGDGSDLVAGTLDLFQTAILGPAFKATAPSNGVQFATGAWPGIYDLTFNVRPGDLFADSALRRALQLCIDVPRDVDAAGGGDLIPIYSPVLSGSWADDPNLPRPGRDTAAARRLIEGAGWMLGSDGIYVKGGRRLAADIPSRSDWVMRVKMTDLIVKDARDCGMDFRNRPASWDDLSTMLNTYPHDIPGTKTPFDLYISGWTVGVDPADGLGLFATSNISDAKHPDNPNFGGFSDPAFDALLAAGLATNDQAERTRIYRQAQELLASELPAIFLWGQTATDAVRTAVSTVDGTLDLAALDWTWQPERLVVAAPNH
jgi:ABC-type transport system substrate-binding protein